MAAVQHQANQLHDERSRISEQIAAALGTQVSETEVEAEFAGEEKLSLEDRWEALSSRLEAQQTRLKQLIERRGTIQQEMKALAADRRLSEARLELCCLQQQLDEAVGRWQVLAVTSLLLASVREIYETERQPETLRAASQYLEQLTDGVYVRIWTPLDQDVLRVDSGQGQTLPVELLSRGTREAVFLALRLALVVSYARRGAVLPLVLDDVLVNFDADRTKAAAKVLRDFAKQGHQLLLFTCHDHIMKVFKRLKVEVRILPDRSELAAVEGEIEIDEPIDNVVDDVVDEEPLSEEDETDESEDDSWEEFDEAEDEYEEVEEDDGDYEYEDDDEYEAAPTEEPTPVAVEVTEVDPEEEEEEELLGLADEEDEYEIDEEDDEEYDLEPAPANGAPVTALLEEDFIDDEEVDDEDYDLEEEYELEADEEDEDDDDDDESVLEIEEFEDDEDEDEVAGTADETDGGPKFTWDSPEMWWDKPSDAA